MDNANQPATGTPFLVEECQLGDPGPKVWHDDTDSNQPPAEERTERERAIVDVVLELEHLGLDGVFP